MNATDRFASSIVLSLTLAISFVSFSVKADHLPAQLPIGTQQVVTDWLRSQVVLLSGDVRFTTNLVKPTVYIDADWLSSKWSKKYQFTNGVSGDLSTFVTQAFWTESQKTLRAPEKTGWFTVLGVGYDRDWSGRFFVQLDYFQLENHGGEQWRVPTSITNGTVFNFNTAVRMVKLPLTNVLWARLSVGADTNVTMVADTRETNNFSHFMLLQNGILKVDKDVLAAVDSEAFGVLTIATTNGELVNYDLRSGKRIPDIAINCRTGKFCLKVGGFPGATVVVSYRTNLAFSTSVELCRITHDMTLGCTKEVQIENPPLYGGFYQLTYIR